MSNSDSYDSQMDRRALDTYLGRAQGWDENEQKTDDAGTNPTMTALQAITDPAAWLAQRLSEAQERERREQEEREEQERIQRESEKAEAIERREAELRELISEEMRAALSMRYETYKNADSVWRAKAVIVFDGQELDLFRDPYTNYRLYDQSAVTGASLLAELYMGSGRFEHNLCLALAEYREALRRSVEAQARVMAEQHAD